MICWPRPTPEARANTSRDNCFSLPSPWAPRPGQGGLRHSPPGAGARLFRAAPARVRKRCMRRERPTHGVPRVPCGGLRGAARPAAASASSRAPDPGSESRRLRCGRSTRSSAVPFPRAEKIGASQDCFPAASSLITLLLPARKAVAFGRDF